jgi:putative membrane protein
MKKLKTVVFAACAAGLLAACNGPQKDGKEKADSANKSVDSTEKVQPNNGVAVSEPDAKFAVEAANGGMSEVMLGNLAKQKATNPQVKDFGDMMVMDHTKANDEMKQIAAAKKITLPDSVASEEKKLMADLSEKKGADFDKAYVNAMVDDHKADIKAFEEARKKVTYPELQAFIDKTLPVLHKHLDAIQKIHDQMKLQ